MVIYELKGNEYYVTRYHTFHFGFSLSLPATTEPAVPEPTTMKSYWSRSLSAASGGYMGPVFMRSHVESSRVEKNVVVKSIVPKSGAWQVFKVGHAEHDIRQLLTTPKENKFNKNFGIQMIQIKKWQTETRSQKKDYTTQSRNCYSVRNQITK